MDYGSGEQSYHQRNGRATNLGEQLFETWCTANDFQFYRLGYQEKTGPIPGWYKVADAIRQMPDYLVAKEGRLATVSVKGTWKFKTEDYDRLSWFQETYATERCPFRFVIATTKGVTWLTTDELRQCYEASTVQGVWPDGKAWRELSPYALAK